MLNACWTFLDVLNDISIFAGPVYRSLNTVLHFFFNSDVSFMEIAEASTLRPRYIELAYIKFLHTLRIFFAFKYH